MPIIKNISFENLNIDVEYIIGKNAKENFEIIDNSEDYHLWFHVKDQPSNHVVAKLENKLKKKDLRYIIKQGAVLTKQYSKFNNYKNLEIIYTEIKNVTKTEIIGSVIVKNEKNITI
jgi:predicted ribosome quality control (RQC) complex YloA/Tae2 family protein